jgi:excisionase family DNA binding protein
MKKLLTKVELAELLHITPNHVMRLYRTRKIPGIHVGKPVRFDLDAVMRALNINNGGAYG